MGERERDLGVEIGGGKEGRTSNVFESAGTNLLISYVHSLEPVLASPG